MPGKFWNVDIYDFMWVYPYYTLHTDTSLPPGASAYAVMGYPQSRMYWCSADGCSALGVQWDLYKNQWDYWHDITYHHQTIMLPSPHPDLEVCSAAVTGERVKFTIWKGYWD